VSQLLAGTSHEIIRNPTNIGFTSAVQQGIDRRQGRHVLLLNNDCRVLKDTLEKMLSSLSGGVASVCPVTNDRGRCSLKHAENNKPGLRKTDVLPWFCCLLNRDALRDWSTLPHHEDVSSGLGVDDWWSKQMVKKGWRHYINRDAFAFHDHSMTFAATGQDRDALQGKAIQWLRRTG